jgi:Bacterial Ig-like domain (group 3)
MPLSKEAAMSRKIQFVCLFVLLGLLSLATQPGFAQSPPPPLNFGNNFFVTGDYIVAGAYNMNQKFTTINGVSYATGTISVPDTNPGITGTNQVPTGAQVVAALLYWQTVEKVGVKPGAPGSGQNGYFRPMFSGGPAAPGYAISGTNLTSPGNTTVSWSSGGCSGGSTGKLLRTYRADVAGGLPVDASGNSIANGRFEVRLPSVGNSTPITMGATLVVIYRILSGAGGPTIPLNSIVIYDGDYGQSNAQTMTQQLQGFYDADANPVSRLTHIVGSGQSNKFQTVYLGSGANSLLPLPSLYGNKLPPFPGWYGKWDNPTWTFTNASMKNPGVLEDASSATTQVVPSPMNQGCVSWGAVIVSTTVKDPDNDGILYSWKDNHGYCDVALNPSCNKGDPAWVDLTGAAHNQQDVFLQYDYMCSKVTGPNSCTVGGANADYSFDPRLAVDTEDGLTPHANAIDKVVASYANYSHHSPVVLHAMPGNAISESLAYDSNGNIVSATCTDSDLTCPFPNEPGTVGFREGLAYIKNQVIETQTGILGCDPTNDPNCVAVFPHGKKDSYHYALFSHGVGLPNWFLSDGSLKSVTQSGSTVTFTTSSPHGIAQIVAQPTGATAKDNSCLLGRVTVVFALTNSALEGTYCILSSPPPTATTFAIKVGGTPTTTKVSYTSNTDPNLAVANGQVTSMSGYSDVGGQNSVISLGYGNWGPPNTPTSDGNKWQMKAGTFMHELGHTMARVHGGGFYNNLANNDYTPTYEANCKPNVQSVMSYLFQFDLLEVPGKFNAKGNPLMVVDYSEEALPTLTESSPQGVGVLINGNTVYDRTAWFQLTSYAGSALTLSSAANAAGGSTVYAGTITGGGGNALAGLTFTVAGFTNGANNGTFVSTASTTTTLTLSNASGVAETHAATASTTVSPHCDGTPLLGTDQPMSYVSDLTSNFFWSSATGEDINFDGSSSDVMHGYNEWEGTPAEGVVGPSPGLDLRQVSAVGTISTIGPGGEAGGLKPAGGGGGLKPAGGGGGLKPAGGGGGLHPAGGGGGLKPAGGGGLSAEITHNQANSYARPPRDLTIVQEEASPRYIDLSWFAPTFGQVVQYNIYRSAAGVAGGQFTFLTSVPGTQTTYQDKTVTCNPGGYHYRVTAVVNNDAGQPLESVPSNIVPATGEPLLTGCYTVSNFSVPAKAVQGSSLQVSWTLTDDFYTTPPAPWAQATSANPVTRQAANTLVAIGPLPGNCTTSGRTTLVADGIPTNAGTVDNGSLDAFTPNANNFTFTWNRTDAFCAGSYTFELDLDHVNVAPAQKQPGPNALQLGIDINDQDTPRIDTLSLPPGVVGLAYSDTLTEDGGTAPFTWTATGLPSGISQQPLNTSPTLAGTACVASLSNVTATVTDSKSNSGSQAFTLQVNKANTTTGVTSNANPSVFQQMVTFTVTVAPQYSCTPTGTVTLLDGVTQIGSKSLTGGTATFAVSTLSVGVHSITANYGGDLNFNSSNSAAWSQTVNKASTVTSVNSVSPSPAFVGQPITVSYTFAVVAPGAGSPIPPSGNITVSASDGSSCMAPAALGSGACVLAPTPTNAGTVTFIITYSGDSNFVGSGANGNYTVYQLVFTTQPSNTGVGLTMPAVLVAAQDNTNTTLASFTGSITLAIGSGPGTLSGTTTQNAVSGVATFGDLSINKIANGYTLTASPSGGVPDATSNGFNIDTYYVDGNGNFGTLDLATGVVTQIGAGTAPGSTGMDLTPGIQVYEYNTSNQLIQITPSTGAATLVGAGSIPDQATTGTLTDGSYFGIDMVTGNLYSINLTTGATTLVGATSSALVPAGCSFEASLTGSANVLYYTIGSQGGGTGCTAFTDTLYQINPTSGATTTIGQVTISGSGVNAFVGSTFVSGTVYGFTSGGQEYAINPANGVATSLTNTTVPILGAGSSE